jgi:hypothetical protein
MAIDVKSAAEIAAKWSRIASTRGADYEAGAVGAGAKWEAGASNGAANFQAAVTAGDIGKMYRGGIKQAGAEKYTRKIKSVGTSRFSGGVTAAEMDMQKGIEPMLATISSLTLSKRAPRGSESNLARVREVATALHLKRLALRAAGA